MRRTVSTTIVAVFVLSAIATSSGPAHAASARRQKLPSITSEGFGRVKLGMTVAQARRATGRRLRYAPPNPNEPYCGVLDLGVARVQARLVKPVKRGPARIAEISTDNPPVRADRGVGIGSTAAGVMARYPRTREGGAVGWVALLVQGRLGELAFGFQTDPGKPIPKDAKVFTVLAVANAYRDTDELCA